MKQRMYNQIREVEILYESQQTQNEREQKVYKITYNDLDINFDIRFTNDKKSNMCYIDLYNISDKTCLL